LDVILIEQAEYDTKVQERAEKARQTGRTPRGRAPKPPTPGPQDKDQYTFTDPESRSMKHRSTQGFEQEYNTQIAVDQKSLLIVGASLSNHPTDQHEAEPTLDAISPVLGTRAAAAFDNGFFSAANIAGLARLVRSAASTHRRGASLCSAALHADHGDAVGASAG
jgi:hypothetical protein